MSASPVINSMYFPRMRAGADCILGPRIADRGHCVVPDHRKRMLAVIRDFIFAAQL